MSEDQDLNPKVRTFLGLVRRNYFVSLAIATITLFVAATGVVHEVVDLWRELRPLPEPNLSIEFLDQKQPQSILTVNPSWKNRFGSDFSDPLNIPIALQNSGTAAATHIEVHLVYPPGVLNLEKSTGIKTLPAVLGNLMTITGYENVETFDIDRIDPSPVANVFERDLQLQFRFRQTLGIPMIIDGIPTVVPISLDFRSSYSKTLDEFPIIYVINFSESDKATTGSIIMHLDQNKHSLFEKQPLDTTIRLIKKNSPPSLTPGKRTETVNLHFLADGWEGVKAACNNTNPKLVTARAFEERNDSDVWTDIVFENGQEIVLLDRGDDGTLDRIFIMPPGGEWVEGGPTTIVPYVPLGNVLNISTNTCLATEITSALGLKH